MGLGIRLVCERRARPIAEVIHLRHSTAVGTKLYWPALLLSLLPAACLLMGFVTGRIPQRYGMFDRQSQAPGFWMMVVVWGFLTGILLWIGLRL